MQPNTRTEIDLRGLDQPRSLDTLAFEQIIQHDLSIAQADGVDLDLALFLGLDLTSKVCLRVNAVQDGLIIGTMLPGGRFDHPSNLLAGQTLIRISNVGMIGRINAPLPPPTAKSQP
jgi:hypothetical protein